MHSDAVGCKLVQFGATWRTLVHRCKLVKKGTVGCKLVQTGATC